MRRLVAGAVCLACVGLAVARADDKPNPTGTWKWTVEFNNQKREQTLKLKLDGDKLTGTMLGRNNQEFPIEDGKFKDGDISFKVVREFNGQKFTSKYSGKVSGDAIKGKMEFDFNGETQSRDWEPKRVKE